MKTSWEYPRKGRRGILYDLNTLKGYFERFKYPILILAIGLILMLLPEGENKGSSLPEKDALIANILSNAEGIGEALVLISDKGVIVVCEGADKAGARLEIIDAVSSYTGYSSDRIAILKMHT